VELFVIVGALVVVVVPAVAFGLYLALRRSKDEGGD
jgi:hypothetical protein